MTSYADELPPKLYAAYLVEAVSWWPKEERRWWRELLDTHPEEAIFLAEMAAAFEGVAFSGEALTGN